jgi:hypothetical protein
MSATQRANLLRLLLSRRGEWIPASEVAAVGGLQYGARLYELRHEQNYEIESRTERVRTGRQSVVKHSWFRLLTDVQQRAFAAANGKPIPKKASARADPGLFDEFPESATHRDDGSPPLFDYAPTHRDE